MTDIAPRFQMFKYTGSGAAAIIATQTNNGDYTLSVTSESGGNFVLRRTLPDTTFEESTIHTDEYLIFAGTAASCSLVGWGYSQATVDGLYLIPATATGLKPYATGAGTAAIPSLALGASATVQVTITPTQSDATYKAKVRLVGGIGGLSITGTSVVSATRVDVTVQSAIIFVAGNAQILVDTYRD